MQVGGGNCSICDEGSGIKGSHAIVEILSRIPSDISIDRLGRARRRTFFGNFREIMFIEYENGFELCFIPNQVRVYFSRGRKIEAYASLSRIRKVLEEYYAMLR